VHFVFVCTPGRTVDTARSQNVGYDYERVMAALARFDAQGHSHEVVDGTALSAERREALESDARLAFIVSENKRKGRRLGNSFGTNREPFQDFGTDIPVLLVYRDGRCVDVYPHNESYGTATVADYLTRATD
jgi:hypothetical protein